MKNSSYYMAVNSKGDYINQTISDSIVDTTGKFLRAKNTTITNLPKFVKLGYHIIRVSVTAESLSNEG